MKKHAICLVCAAAIALSGCNSVLIKKGAVGELQKVGLLSMDVQKVGPPIPNNLDVMQAVADSMPEQAEAKLKEITNFSIVPLVKYRNLPAYKQAGTFAKSEVFQAYMKEKVDQDPKFVMGVNLASGSDTAGALGAMFSASPSPEQKSKAVINATLQTQAMVDKSRDRYAGPRGMPFLPYDAFKPKQITTRKGSTTTTSDNSAFTEMLRTYVGRLCDKLGLDAVIIVHASAYVPPVGSVRVITGNRVLGLAKLNMTMLMINRRGEIVADLGAPSMDDLAPSKGYLPTYIVTAWKGKSVAGTAMDLKDPKGSVLAAFKELVVDASGKMVTTLRQAMGEIK